MGKGLPRQFRKGIVKHRATLGKGKGPMDLVSRHICIKGALYEEIKKLLNKINHG